MCYYFSRPLLVSNFINSYCHVKYDFSDLLLDKNKKLLKMGDKIKNEKYAKTLERVQNNSESFYSGKLADDIAEDIRKANGTITVEDLKKYKSINRKPYKGELSGMNMYLTPPPTSGAVLALILNILKGGCCSSNILFLTLVSVLGIRQRSSKSRVTGKQNSETVITYCFLERRSVEPKLSQITP